MAVDFDASRCDQPLRRLIVTVNSADEPLTPPRPFRFAICDVESGSLQTRIELARAKRYDIRVAVVDAHGRPSVAQVFLFAPHNRLRELLRQITGFAGRLVHLLRHAAGTEYASPASG